MGNKKIKAMRRALREELKNASVQFTTTPTTYINMYGHTMLKYKFQYANTGGKQLLKVAKKIYKYSGLLPR